MRGIIVEPSRLHQAVLLSVFENTNIDVDVADSLENAQLKMADGQYDLACIAFKLSDGSGIDLVHWMNQEKPETKIVMLTQENTKESVVDAVSAGVSKIFHYSNHIALHEYVVDIANKESDEKRHMGRVLYIEDNPAVALVIQQIIRRMGAEVVHCTSGDVAIECLANQEFDIALIDVILPGEFSGDDLVRYIRAMDEEKSQIPILMLSGQENVSRRIELLKLGANDYIAKPVIDEELMARLSNLMTQRKLYQQVKRQQDKLHQLAITDQLTTLYNRHFLASSAPKRLSEAQRHGFDVSLLVVDLDYFKEVNDKYGHEMGDSVLREVALLLKQNCRNEDIAIRLGGEEFVLLMLHCNEDGAVGKAEQLRSEIEKLKPSGIPMTASFGVTYMGKGESKSFSELFAMADKALYEAKRRGRNRVISKCE